MLMPYVINCWAFQPSYLPENVTVVVSTEEISEIQKFNFWYPFSTGNLTFDNYEDCVTEKIIEDSRLIYHNTIIITPVDPSVVKSQTSLYIL